MMSPHEDQEYPRSTILAARLASRGGAAHCAAVLTAALPRDIRGLELLTVSAAGTPQFRGRSGSGCCSNCIATVPTLVHSIAQRMRGEADVSAPLPWAPLQVQDSRFTGLAQSLTPDTSALVLEISAQAMDAITALLAPLAVTELVTVDLRADHLSLCEQSLVFC
jgi:hypothetical protein